MGAHVAGLLCRLRVAVVLSESVGHMHRAPPETPPRRRFVLPGEMLSECGSRCTGVWLAVRGASCGVWLADFVSLSESASDGNGQEIRLLDGQMS